MLTEQVTYIVSLDRVVHYKLTRDTAVKSIIFMDLTLCVSDGNRMVFPSFFENSLFLVQTCPESSLFADYCLLIGFLRRTAMHYTTLDKTI